MKPKLKTRSRPAPGCPYLNGEPIEGVSLAEQALRWCRRHPMPAGLVAALVTFLVIMTLGAISLARGQETAKRAQIKKVKMNSAAMVAGTMLSQFRALSRRKGARRRQGDPDRVHLRPLGCLI